MRTTLASVGGAAVGVIVGVGLARNPAPAPRTVRDNLRDFVVYVNDRDTHLNLNAGPATIISLRFGAATFTPVPGKVQVIDRDGKWEMIPVDEAVDRFIKAYQLDTLEPVP